MLKQLTVEEREKRNKYLRDWRLKKKLSKKEKKISATSVKRVAVAAAVAAKIRENPALPIGAAMREVGMSEWAAKHPAEALTSTKEWGELLDDYLPNGEVLDTHRGLLRASNIDHMIFADGPKDEAQCSAYLTERNLKNPQENPYTRDDVLTDDDIKEMLLEKNCTVRRITRTDRSRHVYFFAPDNRARKDALDMVYKLRGSYAVDKAAVAFSLVALAKASEALRAPQSATETLPKVDDKPQLPRAV